MRALVIGMLAAVALTGCGHYAWTDDETLITDSEIDSMKSTIVATSPDLAAKPGASYVKISWGYLAGKFRDLPAGWIDWTGSLVVDSGAATLQSLVYFDWHDTPLAPPAPNEIVWKSKTLPHYDGLIALVEPGVGSDRVHLQTASFATDLTAADLAKGINEHFYVDADQHEVTITSIPADGCGGFAYGYEKPSRKGWLAFGGRFTDPTGRITGRLRFRGDGPSVIARLTDDDKNLLAEGTGWINDSAFEMTLTNVDGTTLGKVKGVWQPPTYSVRGAFQATWSCAK